VDGFRAALWVLIGGFAGPQGVSCGAPRIFVLEDGYAEGLALVTGRKARSLVIDQETKALLEVLCERCPIEKSETHQALIGAILAGCFEVLRRVFILRALRSAAIGLKKRV
jgi:hypothetical protein